MVSALDGASAMLDPSEDAASIGRHYETATTLPRWRAGRGLPEGALQRPVDGTLKRLQGQLAAEKLVNAICAAALDQQSHGSIIVTATGEIVFANSAAERLARSGGLVLSIDGATCTDKREAALPALLIESAAQGATSTMGCNGREGNLLIAVITHLTWRSPRRKLKSALH